MHMQPVDIRVFIRVAMRDNSFPGYKFRSFGTSYQCKLDVHTKHMFTLYEYTDRQQNNMPRKL